MNDVSLTKNGFFSEGQWLFGLLCLITFLVAITTGHNVFRNAWLIFGYEALFVVGFLVFRGVDGFSGSLFPVKSVAFWLVTAWFGSVTLSLLFSPYGLMMEWFAVSRYFQTLFHMLFFLCVMNFLSRYRGSFAPLMLAIPASVFVLALVFIGAWLALDSSQKLAVDFWYIEPPLNAHIRITDFLATAATVLLVPFFSYKRKGLLFIVAWLGVIVSSMVIWGFLFWCGGRGGIISALSASLLFLVAVKIRKRPVISISLMLLFVVIGGVVIAHLFTVFPWNGVLGATERTLQGGTDIYHLSNSRFDYWMSVLESLRETGSYAFGLGSQGYCYMPSRIYAFQPHNLVFQFLAEWGIAGTALFLSLLVYGFFKGLKTHVFGAAGKLAVPAIAAGALIVSLGLHSLVDGIFYHAQSSFYLVVAFAVWMVPSKE